MPAVVVDVVVEHTDNMKQARDGLAIVVGNGFVGLGLNAGGDEMPLTLHRAGQGRGAFVFASLEVAPGIDQLETVVEGHEVVYLRLGDERTGENGEIQVLQFVAEGAQVAGFGGIVHVCREIPEGCKDGPDFRLVIIDNIMLYT